MTTPTNEAAERLEWCEHRKTTSLLNWVDDVEGGTKPDGNGYSIFCRDCDTSFQPVRQYGQAEQIYDNAKDIVEGRTVVSSASEAAPSPDPRYKALSKALVIIERLEETVAETQRIADQMAAPSLLQERDRLDVERFAKAWWVAIQARTGGKAAESRRRWDREQDRDTEHMRSIYRSVAVAAVAEYARLAATPTAEEPTR